jgi:hypothetical protein
MNSRFETRAHPIGHGDAVTGGDVRVGGIAIDLARATGSEHGDRRRVGANPVGLDIEHVGPKATGAAVDFAPAEQIDGVVVFEDFDVVVLFDGLDQRAGDLGPGRVAVVHDAALRVPALAAQGKAFAALIHVESRAEFLRESADQARRPLHGVANEGLIPETRSDLEGVRNVGVDRVRLVEHRRDASLGPSSVRRTSTVLGHDSDLAAFGHPQREVEAS